MMLIPISPFRDSSGRLQKWVRVTKETRFQIQHQKEVGKIYPSPTNLGS